MLGQLFKKGPVEIFSMIRSKFTGVGWAAVFVSWIISIYYAIILCWAVYYFLLSFYSPLPWSPEALMVNNNATDSINSNSNSSVDFNSTNTFMNIDFFKTQILKKSSGIDQMGSIDTNLMLCLFITYILIYLCISKGVQSSAKVAYFTAPAPIILTIILMFK